MPAPIIDRSRLTPAHERHGPAAQASFLHSPCPPHPTPPHSSAQHSSPPPCVSSLLLSAPAPPPSPSRSPPTQWRQAPQRRCHARAAGRLERPFRGRLPHQKLQPLSHPLLGAVHQGGGHRQLHLGALRCRPHLVGRRRGASQLCCGPGTTRALPAWCLCLHSPGSRDGDWGVARPNPSS